MCNIAIARYARAQIRSRRGAARTSAGTEGPESALAAAALRRWGDESLQLQLDSDFPFGAGLGGSSAAGVAVVGALARLRGESLDRSQLAERSRQLEVEDLGVAGGRQDHYAAAHGGALALTFEASTRVHRIKLPLRITVEIQRRFLILYTGQSRVSGRTITAVLDAYRQANPLVRSALAAMRDLARQMAQFLEAGDLDQVGSLVGEHWVRQKELHPEITTDRIDQLILAAESAGALGGKALGASGGGCVLLIARNGEEERLRAAVEPLAEPLSFSLDLEGLKMVDLDGLEVSDASPEFLE